jgi:hypothetical protein
VGNVPLSNVTITDNKPGVTPAYISGDTNSNNKLDLTETWIFEASGTAITGNYSNTGTASGSYTDTAGHSRTDTETDTSSYFGASPQLRLTKSANPTIFSYAGQVIVYTYVVQNTGNVTLSGPFNINDNKLGTFQCGTATSLAPGASISCTRNYTIQATDIKPLPNSITNTATATGRYGTMNVTSNQAQATINQVAASGRITPTQTTCQQFRDGTSGDLTDEFYNIQSNKINSIAPGVFFYYSKITAPAGSFTFQVQQSNTSTLNWGPIKIQDLGQAIVWKADCTRLQTTTATYNATSGTVTINVTGATTGATYYVGIKYDPASLVGKSAVGRPTVQYTFVSYLNGAEIISSWDSVAVKPK